MSASAVPVSPFRGYRFPPEIITHAVWRHPRRGDKWYLDEVALTEDCEIPGCIWS